MLLKAFPTVHFLSCNNEKENIPNKNDIENYLPEISNKLDNSEKGKDIKNTNVKCHFCGKSFKHHKNLKIHHTKLHNKTVIKRKLEKQKSCKMENKEKDCRHIH